MIQHISKATHYAGTSVSSDKTLTFFYFKGNAQFVQKVTFNSLMDFEQNLYLSWKYYKH